MRLFTSQEPELQFAEGTHICPRAGIYRFSVFDSVLLTRRERINVGAVGHAEGLEKLSAWLLFCSREIPAKRSSKPNLFSAFPGFNRSSGFKAEFLFNEEIARQIPKVDLKEISSIDSWERRIEEAVEMYFREIKFLAQNRTVDVIVCVLPDSLYGRVAEAEAGATGEEIFEGTAEVLSNESHEMDDEDPEDEELTELEYNFRRLLKARVMTIGRPIQIVREKSLQSGALDQQDDATKAWNFCTALYYKSGQTIPWKRVTSPNRPTVCAMGISFYRSRDRRSLSTSLAQMFDELGNGLILRGTPLAQEKDDRRPYMTEEQAGELLKLALLEYKDALKTMPARVVVHKSSNFRDAEIEGMRSVAQSLRIDALDFVTIMDSSIRLFRNKPYPPCRGVRVQLDSETHLLYTRGSVPFYETYTGRYIPSPLEIRIKESEESASTICDEILSLTKMNWNNTQFDGKYPVTLGCSRKVGEILKYFPEGQTPQVRYSYYM